MFGALPSEAQLLVFQFAGAPTGAELMATSMAARPPPEVMYALHRVWMPRYVNALADARRMVVRADALADARLVRIQTLEAREAVLLDRIEGYSERVNTRARGESRRA
jgi:hypothetical protein